jgi:hypothetical protein
MKAKLIVAGFGQNIRTIRAGHQPKWRIRCILIHRTPLSIV